MNTITLHNKSNAAYTQISNTFIDEYMPTANGSYVKVYLLILRILSDYSFTISIPQIADTLELTESDVKRAFVYWEKKGLLSVSRNSKGVISDISVDIPEAVTSAADSPITDIAASDATVSDTAASVHHTYTSAEIRTVASQTDFKWIITIIEKYMERTLTPADVETAVFIYDSLHFTSDLMLFLYESCISRGKKSARYIQTVAINWANEGIDTVEKADKFSMRFETNYIEVMKTFGLNGIPAPAQKKYIDSWLSSGFSPEMIKEACSRTLIAINEPSFKYANSILDNWKKAKVTSLADVKKADAARADKTGCHVTRTSNAKAQPARQNSFNSYEQRRYSSDDYMNIEKQLLNN